MAEWVQQAREFARGPYAEALQQGDQTAAAEFDAMAAKVAAITGLSVEYVKEAKLRISATRFRKELLRGDERILGTIRCAVHGLGPGCSRGDIRATIRRTRESAACMSGRSTTTSREN